MPVQCSVKGCENDASANYEGEPMCSAHYHTRGNGRAPKKNRIGGEAAVVQATDAMYWTMKLVTSVLGGLTPEQWRDVFTRLVARMDSDHRVGVLPPKMRNR